MATKKAEEKKAKVKPISIYEKDETILESEGNTFNFSAFCRWSLRQESLRNRFKLESD